MNLNFLYIYAVTLNSLWAYSLTPTVVI